jgi:hypothetical protein
VSGRKNKKTETSVFVIADKTEIYLLNGETECGNLSPAVTRDHFALTYGDMSSWDLSAPVILPGLNNEGYPVQTSQMSPLKGRKCSESWLRPEYKPALFTNP